MSDDLAIFQSDPFESPKLLIGGAKRHFAVFKAEEERLSTAEEMISCKGDPHEPGAIIATVKSSAIPSSLKQIVFDMTGNLRSALDHAVFASTLALTGVEHESGTKFPLGDTSLDIDNDVKRGCRNVPTEIKNLLVAFQVHRSGNTTVWALNKMRNTKSHRMLVPFATTPNFRPVEQENPVVTPSWDWDEATGRLKISFEHLPISSMPRMGRSR